MQRTSLHLRHALAGPPHVVLRKAAQRAITAAADRHRSRQDVLRGTRRREYPRGPLARLLPPVAPSRLSPFADCLRSLAQHYLDHRFDLLGSGRVRVAYGMACCGLEGHRYEMGEAVQPDPDGRWLAGRITPANLAEAQRAWRLITPGYTPIDWQIDFKSGYRWSEGTWYRRIRYGQAPGADIKVPWELARMQHLPLLAWAYALAEERTPGFAAPDAYASEFRNQVLDFIATNPPRFGVNWHCTMDVAIRAANWAVVYDLFRAQGASFDSEFEAELARSLYEHGLHIVTNLEWDARFRGNHYLADVAGLLFVAAYLPATSETAAWLAFGVQELIAEVEHQFHPDGTNFEASTAYHRLAAELVAYCTALVLRASDERRSALNGYDHRLVRTRPPLRPAPSPMFTLPGGLSTPFPDWYVERLERMAEFTLHAARPDGRVPQVGDNDSGRFLKLQPRYSRLPAQEAKERFVNLEGCGLIDDAPYWHEDALDHRHVVAAINGLFGREDFNAFTGGDALDTFMVRSLAGGTEFPSFRAPASRAGTNPGRHRSSAVRAAPGGGLTTGLSVHAYPDFGLYVYRSARLHLAIRCGPVGQHGRGGHAHNDQLSFELAVDGSPVIVDPGTYVYTPLPEQRNRFRSTAMHSTLMLEGIEQNAWWDGLPGLFALRWHGSGRVMECTGTRFAAEHAAGGVAHRRTFTLLDDAVQVVDECAGTGTRAVAFHLAPPVAVSPPAGGSVLLTVGSTGLELVGGPGDWTVEEAPYSPGYGVLERSHTVRLRSPAGRIEWALRVRGPR